MANQRRKADERAAERLRKPGRAACDIEERTAAFGEAVAGFAKTAAGSPVNGPLGARLVRSARSVGANGCQADDGASGKGLRNEVDLGDRFPELRSGFVTRDSVAVRVCG